MANNCATCLKAILSFEIIRVIYSRRTTNENAMKFLDKLRLCLLTNHESDFWKVFIGLFYKGDAIAI